METTSMQAIGAGIFALALLHTLTAKCFEVLAGPPAMPARCICWARSRWCSASGPWC